MSTIKVRRVHFRSMKDLLLEQATEKVAEVTGQPRSLWASILRWRLRYFQGDASKALACHDEKGEQVFIP